MVKITVLYPDREGARFDEQYYLTTHLALVEKLLGPVLKGAGIDQGIAMSGGQAPFRFIAHRVFESAEAAQAALDQHGPALLADVANYTDIQPVLQFCNVLIERAANPAVAG